MSPRKPRKSKRSADLAQLTVGRQAEIQKLQDLADRGIHTLVLGPPGVGKSHLLKLLQGEKLIRLPGLSPQREAMLTLAEALFERGALRGNSTPAPKDFVSFKRQHSGIGVQGWMRVVSAAVAKDEWTLVIDDLSDLTVPTGQLLRKLADQFVVIAATRQLKESHGEYVAKFDRLSLSKLSREETRLLIRQRTAGMKVEDPTSLETHLLKHGAGNPRLLLRMVNRLRRAPVITPQVVRWAHVPGARPQFNLTPVLLIPLAVLGVAYYLAPDLEDIEFFVLGGIAAALVVGVQLFQTRTPS
ncbi:MAG: ATP-binding protein [Candidatus Latescibacteria bacterium]|nr:ATP-binding protein [Candidatus Latescibacterota bacterium]